MAVVKVRLERVESFGKWRDSLRKWCVRACMAVNGLCGSRMIVQDRALIVRLGAESALAGRRAMLLDANGGAPDQTGKQCLPAGALGSTMSADRATIRAGRLRESAST